MTFLSEQPNYYDLLETLNEEERDLDLVDFEREQFEKFRDENGLTTEQAIQKLDAICEEYDLPKHELRCYRQVV